jgi:hypothetical protein
MEYLALVPLHAEATARGFANAVTASIVHECMAINSRQHQRSFLMKRVLSGMLFSTLLILTYGSTSANAVTPEDIYQCNTRQWGGPPVGANRVLEAMQAAGFPDEQLATGLAIAMAESHLCQHARNPNSSARGIWQILKRHLPEQDAFDVAKATRKAKELYDGGGWRHWEVYNNGDYRNVLEKATGDVEAYKQCRATGCP